MPHKRTRQPLIQVIATWIVACASLVVGSVILCSAPAKAEPWLSTRFAQNCSGCHAPGRKNVPMPYRRCSLNCQGCHVNPSGGGLRSQYGKWNEERWLKSFRTSFLANQKSTAPVGKQKYFKGDWQKAPKLAIQNGFQLVETDETYPDESDYDRRDHLERQTAETGREFLYQMPQGDPYRQMDTSKIDGGGDVRWQVRRATISSTATDGTVTETKRFTSFLMSADIGLRLRPLYRRLHLVYEGRFLGNPNPDAKKRPSDIAATMIRRSLYAMVDELPFSLYLLAGYQRPAFGYMTPDHTALEQRMFSQAVQGNNQAYNVNFETLTVGGSPNLPYFNLHLITNQFGGAPQDSRTKGVVANLGVRWVTLGASATYSYWRTASNLKVNDEDVISQLEMHSIGGGVQVGRATLNLSLVSFAKDIPKQDFRQGGTQSIDSMIRVWRENYINLQLANSNRAEDLSPGSGSQIRYGIRSFLTSGLEVWAYMEKDSQTKTDPTDESKKTSTVANNANLQLHAYF